MDNPEESEVIRGRIRKDQTRSNRHVMGVTKSIPLKGQMENMNPSKHFTKRDIPLSPKIK